MIQFYRGTEDNYNANKESLTDAIVFTTDTHKIYMNEQMYGGGDSSDMYESAMDDDIEVPNAVGGIAAGTTAAELKKKTQSQVLDDLLFPEINPTIVAPSAQATLNGSSFTQNTVYEVGATAPTTTNLNGILNRGSITVPGQTQKYRAGTQTVIQKIYRDVHGTDHTNNWGSNLKIEKGSMQYAVVISYGLGDTALTSKGNKATHDIKGTSITNPLPAGSVKSAYIAIYGNYPYFCNGQSASTTAVDSNLPSAVTANTKLPLVRPNVNLIGAKFASEATTGTRLVFQYPSSMDCTKVEYFNTLGNSWEELSMSDFAKSSAGNKSIQGSNVAYNQITTTGSLKGAMQCRFTVVDN